MSRRRPWLSICLLLVLLLGSLGPAPAHTPPVLAAPTLAPANEESPISQGKPASASSSYCDPGTGECLTPDAANDGDPASYWEAANQWWTDPPGDTTYPQWWQVDLGATYTISRLDTSWLCFFELGCPAYRYTIDLSADGSNFTTIVDRRDNTSEWQTSDSFRASGRFVRITITGYDPNGRIPPYQIAGAFEFQLYGSAGPLALEISDSRGETVEALQLNHDGWPALNAESGAPANPITLTVTLTNTTNAAQLYDLRLSLGSAGDSARLHIFSWPGCLGFEEFSYRQASDVCSLNLQPGGTETLRWGLWVQPSAAATLVASAELLSARDGSLVAGEQAEVDIPQARIHPLVFLHGILGSMAPENLLVTDEDTLHQKLDPFLGSYWPLPEQLQKLGYEWNKSLFVLAYDWRRPIDVSADFLAGQLRDAVIPRSRPSEELPYTAPTLKADLIGHSMGGLVARSYIQRATGYQSDVRKLIFIATPHKGFPFDYRTWEGLTWQNYLYNAPEHSGGLFGTFGKLMDNFIWPRLIRKRFAPSDAELAGDCALWPGGDLLNDVRFVFANSSGIPYECNWNAVAKWSHTIDATNTSDSANRGIRSLFEMLPTDDLALPEDLSPPNAYLVGFGGEAYPLSRQENTYLRDLNSRIGVLSSRLGIANIYNIFGDNAPTDMRYQVGLDPDPAGPNLWRYGVVNESRIVQRPAGDDLIPASSMELLRNGLLSGLPDDNERRIDDEESRERNLGFARHKEIMSQTQVQTEYIPRFLGAIGANDSLPFQVKPGIAPLAIGLPPEFGNVGRMVLVMSDCPINLLITDPLGRRLGYDPATGQMLNEIPGAVATSPFVEPHILVIAQPISGTYQVSASGYDSGSYGIIAGEAELTRARHTAFFSGMTSSGQINHFTFTYTPTVTFPTTPLRDDFNRPDGPPGANWAGDLQEYEIQSQALVPSGGSGAIYWDTPFGPDQEAYVTLSAIDVDADEIDLLLKGQGEGQCDVLEVWYQPRRGTVQVVTCHNFGTWNQHGPDLPVTFQAGDQFGARAKADGTVEVYKNGALIGSVTIDSSWPYRAGGGRIGLWTIQAAGASLDGFGGGNLP